MKQSIVEAERFILKELGFKIWQLTVENSVHSQATKVLETLNIIKKESMSDQDKKVFQEVWSLCNLCYFTILPCCFNPETISLSIIVHNLSKNQIHIPHIKDSDDTIKPWWFAFTKSLDKEKDFKVILGELLAFE